MQTPGGGTCKGQNDTFLAPALLENRNSETGHWFALLAFLVVSGLFLFYTSQATRLSKKEKENLFRLEVVIKRN